MKTVTFDSTTKPEDTVVLAAIAGGWRVAFEKTFAALKASGIPYGDSRDTVGNNRGPGVESGSRGDAPTVYFHDPSGHLLEIRTYE